MLIAGNDLCAMKASMIFFAACPLLLAAGCTDLGDGLVPGRSRTDCHSRERSGGSQDEGGQTVVSTDTTVYLSAVRFEEGYDWRRDSTYGAVSYEIVFYKDFQPVLRIPSSAESASPDLDSHHIIGGHLYTEASSGGRTALGRDGETLFSFEGREILRGLLPVGSDVYTLSESRSGDGFSLRKNGKVIFWRESGSVFGDLADPSYRPYGALYKDQDKISFCYRAGKDRDEHYYMVQDCVETMTSLEWRYWIEDVKVCGGYPRYAELSCLWYELQDGRVWIEEDGCVSVSGWMSYGGDVGLSAVVTDGDPERISEICEGAGIVYHGKSRDYAIRQYDSGDVGIYCAGQRDALFSGGGFLFMSPDCAAMVGDGELCAALTSGSGGVHLVLCAGRKEELRLHGYLSCIRAEVSVSQTR